MITVAGYGKAVAVVNQIEIVGGIIACGVFLLLISIVGRAFNPISGGLFNQLAEIDFC